MRLAPIVDQLKAAKLGRVYGALELLNLQKQPVTLPARFVVPEGWQAKPNGLTGGVAVNQLTSDNFIVVHVLQGRPLREEAVSDELSEAEEATIAALLGWTHPDAPRSCTLVSGRLLSVNGTTLHWATTFNTGRHFRKVNP